MGKGLSSGSIQREKTVSKAWFYQIFHILRGYIGAAINQGEALGKPH